MRRVFIPVDIAPLPFLLSERGLTDSPLPSLLMYCLLHGAHTALGIQCRPIATLPCSSAGPHVRKDLSWYHSDEHNASTGVDNGRVTPQSTSAIQTKKQRGSETSSQRTV